MKVIERRTLIIFHVLPILAAMFLVGCSGPPSESMGRKMLEHKIQGQSNSQIKLVSFRKTNGTGDNNIYQVEYEAEIEFLADGAWMRGSSLDSSVSFEFSTQSVGNNWMAQSLGGLSGATNVKKGQRTTVKSMLRFEKTEKGWRGGDGVVY